MPITLDQMATTKRGLTLDQMAEGAPPPKIAPGIGRRAMNLTNEAVIEAYNTFPAAVLHSFAGADVEPAEPYAWNAQQRRIQGRSERLSPNLLDDEYEDIVRQLYQPPAARESKDLRGLPQFQRQVNPFAVELPPAKTPAQKIVRTGAGLGGTLAAIAVTRKLLPPGTSEPAVWEAASLASGGPVGKGAAMGGVFSWIKGIPAISTLGKATRLGAESAALGGMTAISGGDTQDIIISSLIPIAFAGYGAVRGRMSDTAMVKQWQEQLPFTRDIDYKASLKMARAMRANWEVQQTKDPRLREQQLRQGYREYGPVVDDFLKQADTAYRGAYPQPEPTKPAPSIKGLLTAPPVQEPVPARPAPIKRPPVITEIPGKEKGMVRQELLYGGAKPPQIEPVVAPEALKPPEPTPTIPKEQIAAPAQPERPPEAPSEKPIVVLEVAKTLDELAEKPADIRPEVAPIVEIPVKSLQLSKDVPNFKERASRQTGIIPEDRLQGKYERLGTGAIVVWERNNGRQEVITGRHRLDLAKRTGQATIPAQVVKESEGFDKNMAMTIDAEANIRDAQGSVKDYASYFRITELSEDDARAKGLLSRAKGKTGWDIGKSAGDDVFTRFANGQINEAKAAAIARGAPKNDRAQQLALMKSGVMSAEELEEFVRMTARLTPSDLVKPRQGNLFGYDESAIEEAEAIAKEVSKERASIKDRILAVKGALKRPAQARKMGLEFSDEKAIAAEVKRLETRLDELTRVATTPELYREMMVRADLKPKEISGPTVTTPPGAIAAEQAPAKAKGFIPVTEEIKQDIIKTGHLKGRQVRNPDLPQDGIGTPTLIKEYPNAAYIRPVSPKTGYNKTPYAFPDWVAQKGIGSKGYEIITKDGNRFFLGFRESDKQIYIPEYAVQKERAGEGTRFVQYLKEYADKTGKTLQIGRVAIGANTFWDKFPFLTKLDDMTYEYVPAKQTPAPEGKVTRQFYHYTAEERATRAASHRLSNKQKESVGEYYYTTDDVPNVAFKTAKEAKSAAEQARPGGQAPAPGGKPTTPTISEINVIYADAVPPTDVPTRVSLQQAVASALNEDAQKIINSKRRYKGLKNEEQLYHQQFANRPDLFIDTKNPIPEMRAAWTIATRGKGLFGGTFAPGFDRITPIVLDSAIAIAKTLARGGKNVHRMVSFYTGRAASVLEKHYGDEGRQMARDTREIDFQAARRYANQNKDLEKLLKPLSRKDRENLIRMGLGHEVDAKTKARLAEVEQKVRYIMDSDMHAAGAVGYKRLVEGEWRDIQGSGKWAPHVLNETGKQAIQELHQQGKGSPRIKAAIEQMVADGKAQSEEEAYAKLLDWSQKRVRGTHGYFEMTRVPLPESWLELDAGKILPPLLYKNAYMIEAARVWGLDTPEIQQQQEKMPWAGGEGGPTIQFTKAQALIKQIGLKYGSNHANALTKWLRTNFGLSNDLPTAVEDTLNALNHYLMITRLGLSIPSPIRNLTQATVNLFTAPLSAHFGAIKTQVMRRWSAEAQRLYDEAYRAGAVLGRKEMGETELLRKGREPISMKMFGASEESNHYQAALKAAPSARKHIIELAAMREGATLRKLLLHLKYASVNPERYLRELLRDRTFTNPITDAELDEILKRPLSLDEVQRIMHRASVDTQFVQNLSTRPIPWKTNPWLRTALKFKTFGIHQTRLIWDEAIKQAAKGTFAPLLKYLLFATIGGEVYNIARDLIVGGDSSLTGTMINRPEKRSASDIAAMLTNDFIDGAGVGIVTDLVWGVGSLLGGPIGQTIQNAREAASNYQHPILAARRFFRNELAVARQIEPLLARADAVFFNENNDYFAHRRWRDRAYEFKTKAGYYTGRKTGLVPRAGRQVKEFFVGRPRYDMNLPYRYAADQVTIGDIDDAADYLAQHIKDNPQKDYKVLHASIDASMRAHAPFAGIADKDLPMFLNQFDVKTRAEGIALQGKWIANYQTAKKRAFEKARP